MFEVFWHGSQQTVAFAAVWKTVAAKSLRTAFTAVVASCSCIFSLPLPSNLYYRASSMSVVIHLDENVVRANARVLKMEIAPFHR